MNEWIVFYMLIGLLINIASMFNKDVRGYWVEFGVIGFIFQLVISVVFFPLIVLFMIDDSIGKD